MGYNGKNNICGIYRILNLINKKSYIGESKSILDRWWIHKNELKKNIHHSHHLQKAWNKYGEDSFIFEIIEQCTTDELYIKQDEFINRHKSDNRKYGYNILKAGNKWSHEHLVRMKSIFNNNEKRKKSAILSGIKKRGIGIKVVKYSLSGDNLGLYTSIKLAAESESLDSSSVAKCCKRKLNCVGGFIFRYKNDLDITLKENKSKKSVISIDKNGVETEYDSMVLAAKAIGCRSTSTISSCCIGTGKKRICKGFKWRYK